MLEQNQSANTQEVFLVKQEQHNMYFLHKMNISSTQDKTVCRKTLNKTAVCIPMSLLTFGITC